MLDERDNWYSQELDFEIEGESLQKRNKDNESRSRIRCCKSCVTGPKDKNTSPRVTNGIFIFMIGLNFSAMFYALNGTWTWLCGLNIAIGFISVILMWQVQCSDAGIINRTQDKTKLKYYQAQQDNLANTGSFAIDFDDDLISLNNFEKTAVLADMDEFKEQDQDKSLIYREARIY